MPPAIGGARFKPRNPPGFQTFCSRLVKFGSFNASARIRSKNNMRLKGRISLIWVNAILRLKSGVPVGPRSCARLNEGGCACRHSGRVPTLRVSANGGRARVRAPPFALQYCFKSMRFRSGRRKSTLLPERVKQMREVPMTAAGQAFLFAGVLLVLPLAVIPLIYFADRLRSDFLQALNKPSRTDAAGRPGSPTATPPSR